MSVKIHFAFGIRHRIQQAAQTAAKNYRSAKKILVYSTEQKRLDSFSRMLWNVSPTSFVPHERILSSDHLAQLITEEWTEANQPQAVFLLQQSELLSESRLTEKAAEICLLNLDLACPPNYQHFAQVLEIVSEHETDKQYARERWKQYRSDGVELVSHRLGGH